MSIHATFFDCQTYEYDSYPFEPLQRRGHMYFCQALGTDYVRVSLQDYNDSDTHSGNDVMVDIDYEQLADLGKAIGDIIKWRRAEAKTGKEGLIQDGKT